MTPPEASRLDNTPDHLNLQATIQGALGSLPLLLITSRETHQADYEQQVAHGNIILHSTAFAIIIAAPIGLLVIALLGPIWLSKVGPATYLRT